MNHIIFRYIFIIILVSQSPFVRGQKLVCKPLNYGYAKVAKSIYGYLLKSNNYEYFSDNRGGEEVFPNKSAFKKTSRIEVIPVLEAKQIDGLANYDYAHMLNEIYKPSYQQLCAFLLFKGNPIQVIVSSPERNNSPHVPANFGVDSEINIDFLYNLFSKGEKCLFFNASQRTFAYIYNGHYYFWDYNQKIFVEISSMSEYNSLGIQGVTEKK